MPLITATAFNNGIAETVNREDCLKIYPAGRITISDFGDAHYHPYEFAASAHVIVGTLKPDYDKKAFAVFLCAAINNEKWRFSFKPAHRCKSKTIKNKTAGTPGKD